jgi:hypothetical protein
VPTPASPATATTVAATPAAVSAATTAAPATTAAAFGLRPCFVHHQVTPAKILTVQRVHRTVRVFVIVHLDESEPA